MTPHSTKSDALQRAATKRARTPEQRRQDYIESAMQYVIEREPSAVQHCPGEYEHGQYSSYGEKLAEDTEIEAEQRWNGAVAIWNATPETEDGDEKYVAVAAAYDDDLANEMCAMAEECGVVR